MKTGRIFVFAVLLIVFISASAFGMDTAASLTAVEDYAIHTGADSGQTALLLTWALFDPDRLPSMLRTDSPQSLNWFCATPTIIKIMQLAEQSSPEIRMEIEKYIPIGNSVSSKKKGEAKATKIVCPDGEDAFTTNNYQTEHFNFKWGDSTSYTVTDFQAWGVIFEEIWDIEVETWGYEPVLLSDDYFIDIYLANSGDDTPNMDWSGAFTSVYYDGWTPVMPFMAFHPDILGHENSLKDVSSHEFFHTLQFTISLKPGGCYGYMGDPNLWTIEGTAVWAEDECYPDINYYVYHIIPYAEDPHYSLISENRYQIYGRVIWWKYVHENFDGRNTIHTLWNECHNAMWVSIGNILNDAGTDTITEYNKFVIANLFMDYEDGDMYPTFTIHKSISNYPQTYESVPATAPQLFGTNFLKLYPPAKGEDSLVVDFIGDEKINNRSTDWSVQLVAVKDGSDYDVFAVTVEDGIGTYEMEGFGSTYERVYVTITPVVEGPSSSSRSGMYDIHFTLGSLVTDDDDDDATDDDTTDDDTTEDDDDDATTQPPSDDDDDEDKDEGCGC